MFSIKLKDKVLENLSEDDVFDLIYAGKLTGEEEIISDSGEKTFLKNIPIFASAIKAYQKSQASNEESKDDKTVVTQTVATVVDSSIEEPENEELNTENLLGSDIVDPYEEESSMISSVVISKPKKKNKVFLTGLFSLLLVVLGLVYVSYFGIEKSKELYMSKTKLVVERLYSVKKLLVDFQLPSVDSEEYNTKKSLKLFKDAVELLRRDTQKDYKDALLKLQDAHEYDTNNRSILSMIAYTYAKLYYLSKMDTDYINLLNALITRASHGDLDLQTLTIAQVSYQNLISNYDYAVSLFEDAIALLKKATIQPLLLIEGAEAYLGKGDLKTANTILDKLISAEEPYPRIYYLKALILDKTDKVKALEDYNLALKLEPNHIPSLLKVFKNRTKLTLDDFVSLSSKVNYMSLKDASDVLAMYGDYLLNVEKNKNLAIESYKKAVDLYEDNKYAREQLKGLGIVLKVKKNKKDVALLKKESDVNLFIARGDELFNLGKYNDAILQYRMATSMDESNTDAWYKLGEAYRRAYDYEKALKAYNTGLSYNKISVRLLTKHALVNIYLYNFEDAYKTLKKAELLDPDNPDVLYTFGMLYDKRGNDEEAIKYYHKALSNDFSHFDSIVALAKKHYKFKSYDDAELLFKKALAIKPDYFEAYIYIARIKVKKDGINKVINYINGIKKNFPNVPELDLAIATAYMDTKQYDEAERIIKKLRQKYRDSIIVIRYYAKLLLKESRIQEYLSYLNLITILAPYDLDTRYKEAITYCNIKQISLCEQRLLDIVKLTVFYPRVSYKLGEIYYNSNRFADAESALKVEIKYNPGIKGSYLLLGEIYLETNRPEQAVELFRTMLANNPKDPYGFLGLAKSCYYSGDFDCAKDFIAQAKAINPDIVEIYLLECELYYKLNLFNEARSSCKIFLKNAPRHYGAKRASEILLKVS